jgi:hypothetical protein
MHKVLVVLALSLTAIAFTAGKVAAVPTNSSTAGQICNAPNSENVTIDMNCRNTRWRTVH